MPSAPTCATFRLQSPTAPAASPTAPTTAPPWLAATLPTTSPRRRRSHPACAPPPAATGNVLDGAPYGRRVGGGAVLLRGDAVRGLAVELRGLRRGHDVRAALLHGMHQVLEVRQEFLERDAAVAVDGVRLRELGLHDALDVLRRDAVEEAEADQDAVELPRVQDAVVVLVARGERRARLGVVGAELPGRPAVRAAGVHRLDRHENPGPRRGGGRGAPHESERATGESERASRGAGTSATEGGRGGAGFPLPNSSQHENGITNPPRGALSGAPAMASRAKAGGPKPDLRRKKSAKQRAAAPATPKESAEVRAVARPHASSRARVAPSFRAARSPRADALPAPRSPLASHPLAQERAARKRDAKQARKTRAEGAALEGGERACKLCREVRPSAPVGVDARPSSHPRPPISLTAAAAAHAPVVAPRLLPIPPPPRASRSPADPASSRPTPADPSPRVVRSAAAAQGEPRVRGVLRRARRARRPGPRRDRHREIRQGETQGAQRAPRA